MSGQPKPSKQGTTLIPRLILTVIKSAPVSTLGLILGAVGGGLIAAGELLIGKRIVDTLATAVSGSGDALLSDVLIWVGWLAAIMIAAIALEIVSTLSEVDVQERVGIRMQREVITKAHSVELVHFEHPDFYDALQRANQDMGGRLVQLMRALVEVLASVTGIIAIVTVLWQNHWSLAPITVVGVVPGFWVMLAMRKKTYWVYRIRTPESRLAIYFNGLLTRRDEAKEVRLFTLARHLMERWLYLARKLAVERRQLEMKQAWLGALTDMLGLAAYAGCLVIIATLIAGATVTVGTFTMLMDALQRFSQRIEQGMRSLADLHEQSLYLADLYEFLELDVPTVEDWERYLGQPEKSGQPRQSKQTEQPGQPVMTGESVGSDQLEAVGLSLSNGDARHRALEPLPVAASIELQDVWFTYPSGQHPVLRGVNLTIKAGERIALIGENGAGKSTLVRLIMGLYEPSSGRILIDGVDIKDIPPDQLPRYFAAVFQEFVKYQFPVVDNIRFGRLSDASFDDVEWASRLSDAHSFIEAFPDRYDTMLGRPLGGVDLSGGQWQKLAIARALVRRAPIVVLDEPTAALDPKAEAEVYRQFGEMTQGRTSILISHRLGSARLADRIIVLKDGQVEESGTHEQLIAAGGEYAGFFTLQAQWYQ